MPKELAELLGVALTHPACVGVGVVIACAALAGKLDDWLNKETKDEVALRLLCLDRGVAAEAQVRWPKMVTTTLDGIFGEKHWSWKCLLRSVLLSYVAVILMMLILGALSTGGLVALYADLKDIAGISNVAFFTLVSATWLASMNSLADYISLWETRVIVRWVRVRQPTLGLSTIALGLDVLATHIVISGSFAGVTNLIGWYMESPSPFTFELMLLEFPTALMWHRQDASVGTVVMFASPYLTTFLTSAWVWAVIGGTTVLRLLSQLAPAAGFLRSKLDIENRPFRSLGVMAGLTLAAPYWLFHMVMALVG